MNPKPNFTHTDAHGTHPIYMDLETGEITDVTTGYVYGHKRSDSFWDGQVFVPILEGASDVIRDNVNSPSHYGQGKIEAIDYIEDFLNEEEFIGYLRGNIAKYMHRFRYKNGLEDLKKAQWYQNKLIKFMEKTV